MNPALPKNIEKLHESRKGGVKVIITYASAGAGHFKAAEAIYDCFKKQHKEIDVEIVDILKKTNVLFRLSYTLGYSFLINHAVFLWRLAFLATYVGFLRRFTRPIALVINRLNAKSLSWFLEQESPDFVISTHFLPSEISARLKKTGKINSKIISVVTDFGIHPFWISRGTDIYIVASDYTKEQLIKEGIEEDGIKVLGIPVHSKFLGQFEKASLCKKLGIVPDRFTVLLVIGSFGIGPIEEIVGLLHREAQVLVICAKNRNLFKKLKNKKYPNLTVLGFVENVQELMAVSDVIITKPGGMTVSELLAMELVPIFISAIPGQETANAEVMKNYGIGITADNPGDVRDAVIGLRNNPDKLEVMREKIRMIKRPFAAEEICNVVCSNSIGAGS